VEQSTDRSQLLHPTRVQNARWGPRLIACVFVAAVWAVIGFVVLSPNAFYTGDFGVKFVQARSLIHNRFRSMALMYPGGMLDPAGRFFPLRPPLVLPTPSGIQGIYPPTVALYQAVGVLVGGLGGVVFLSLISGVVILWFSARIGDMRAAWMLPIVLGLGTCLWFYAVVPWEHAPAVALDTAALAVAFSRRRSAPLLAGLLLGMGTSLRFESMLLVPGLLLVLWAEGRRAGALVIALAGLTLVSAVAGAVEVLFYQRPPGAHMLPAVHLVRHVFELSGGMTNEVPIMQALSPSERYDAVVHYWLTSELSRMTVLLFVAGAAAAAAIRRYTGSSLGVLFLAVLALGWAAYGLWTLLPAPRWVAGLFRQSPFLVFALFPAPGLSPAARRARLLVIAASAIYVVIAILTTDTAGGKSLGPRHLLPIVPLLTIAAWQGIMAYQDTPRDDLVHRLIGLSGLSLVAMSIVLQLACMLPPYARQNRGDIRALEAVRRSPERILIADDMFTAQLASALYFKKIVLLADTPALAHDLGSLLGRAGMPSALVISREPRGEISLEPYRLVASDSYERFTVQRWMGGP
jgi:hypothetical protein